MGALGETFDWPVPVTMMLVFFQEERNKATFTLDRKIIAEKIRTATKIEKKGNKLDKEKTFNNNKEIGIEQKKKYQ